MTFAISFALAADPSSVLPARYARPEPVVEDPFHWEPQPTRLIAATAGRVEVRLKIPPGYHIYRDMVAMEVLDSHPLMVSAPSLPPGLPRQDPAEPASRREVYDQDAIVWVPITAPAAPGLYLLHVNAHYQGCREGLCFPPTDAKLDIPVRVAAE